MIRPPCIESQIRPKVLVAAVFRPPFIVEAPSMVRATTVRVPDFMAHKEEISAFIKPQFAVRA
jgi:hypothetical protein